METLVTLGGGGVAYMSGCVFNRVKKKWEIFFDVNTLEGLHVLMRTWGE